MPKKAQYDWETIEGEYRAGQLSIKEIARQHGCSDTAIRKKAKKNDWKRDLSQRVRERVREKMVRASVRENHANANDEEIIEASAERGTEVLLAQRKDVQEARSVTAVLLGQLRDAAGSREEIEEAIIEDTKGSGDEQADFKRRAQMLRAISLPAHASTARDLSTALKNLVALERQAFNLDENKVSLEEILDALPDEFAIAVRKSLANDIS